MRRVHTWRFLLTCIQGSFDIYVGLFWRVHRVLLTYTGLFGHANRALLTHIQGSLDVHTHMAAGDSQNYPWRGQIRRTHEYNEYTHDEYKEHTNTKNIQIQRTHRYKQHTCDEYTQHTGQLVMHNLIPEEDEYKRTHIWRIQGTPDFEKHTHVRSIRALFVFVTCVFFKIGCSLYSSDMCSFSCVLCIHTWRIQTAHEYCGVFVCSLYTHMTNTNSTRIQGTPDFEKHTHGRRRGGGLGSRPKKMYGERLRDGVEYHLMSPTPRR